MLIESLDEGEEPRVIPSWARNGDLAERIWAALSELRSEKLEKVAKHTARSDIARKKDYLIFKSEVVARAGCSASSIYNRDFSQGFESHLRRTNCELEAAKDRRVRSLKSVGRKDRRRDELVADIRAMERELESLRTQNTKKMVDEIFARIPLKVRRVLSLS